MNAHVRDLDARATMDSRAVMIKANLNYDARRHKHKTSSEIMRVYYAHLVALARLIAGSIQMLNIKQ